MHRDETYNEIWRRASFGNEREKEIDSGVEKKMHRENVRECDTVTTWRNGDTSFVRMERMKSTIEETDSLECPFSCIKLSRASGAFTRCKSNSIRSH